MKNIETILKDHGIELPDESKDAILKEVNANYKTIAEFNKMVDALSSEKQKVADATESLKKFEGLDPEQTKKEVEDLRKKMADQEKKFNEQMAQRDYDDALAKELADYKFTSKAARASIEEKIRGANLAYKDGKILGLGDFIEQIKTDDADAFKADEPVSAAKITEKGTGRTSGTPMTKDQIMDIKDTSERQAAIAAHPQLFT